MKNLIFLFSLICSSSIAISQALILQPGPAEGKDARIFSLDALGNFGSDVDFIASILNYNGEPGTTRSLIQFDLSSAPKGTSVQSAYLSLYYNPESSTPGHLGDNAAYLRRIIQPWDESTVKWNQQPFYTTDNEVLLPASAEPNQDYVGIDVTLLVRDMVAFPSNSHGFMFMLQTEQGMGSLKFYSSDGSNPDKRPRLEVVFGAVANKEINVKEALLQPNPFTNSFVIRDVDGTFLVTLTDITGKKMLVTEMQSNGGEIVISQLDNLPLGLYVVNASGKSGTYRSKAIKI